MVEFDRIIFNILQRRWQKYSNNQGVIDSIVEIFVGFEEKFSMIVWRQLASKWYTASNMYICSTQSDVTRLRDFSPPIISMLINHTLLPMWILVRNEKLIYFIHRGRWALRDSLQVWILHLVLIIHTPYLYSPCVSQ